MKEKIIKGFFVGISLLTVILLFSIIDHSIHGLQSSWSVPDYYFKNKIPAGFLWGVVGLFLARKSRNVWLKALIAAGVIALALQVRYFIEGYGLSFVLLFLIFHFVILFFLLAAMFAFFKNYNRAMPGKNYSIKYIIAALALLIIAAIGTYYLVFGNLSA